MPNNTSKGRRMGGGGRLYPYNRDTNDSVPIIGDNLAGMEDLAECMLDTTKHGMDDKCRKDYRNRLSRIIKYLKSDHPDYYEIGVVKVSEVDQNNAAKYFFNSYRAIGFL